MSSGELHIRVDTHIGCGLQKQKNKATMICWNCYERIEEFESPGSLGVATFIPTVCPKCGARFSKILGRLK